MENTKLYTRESAIERLLKSYQAYYNIHLMEEEQNPIVARCDFFEHSQRYVLSKKAELWSADSEEFLYLLNIPHLTLELFEQYKEVVREDGMNRLHIGPGHMYSFITPIFICDICDEDARKALKKCRIYKSFHFSLHGWMNFRAAVVELNTNKISTNRSGHDLAKILKKVLYLKPRKGV